MMFIGGKQEINMGRYSLSVDDTQWVAGSEILSEKRITCNCYVMRLVQRP